MRVATDSNIAFNQVKPLAIMTYLPLETSCKENNLFLYHGTIVVAEVIIAQAKLNGSNLLQCLIIGVRGNISSMHNVVGTLQSFKQLR